MEEVMQETQKIAQEAFGNAGEIACGYATDEFQFSLYISVTSADKIAFQYKKKRFSDQFEGAKILMRNCTLFASGAEEIESACKLLLAFSEQWEFDEGMTIVLQNLLDVSRKYVIEAAEDFLEDAQEQYKEDEVLSEQ